MNAIADVDARYAIVAAFVDVAEGRRRGQPLENLAHVGDLSDCYKVYVDYDHTRAPRWRLVYRLISGQRAEAVQVQAVAAGRRQALEVYRTAANRLGRASGQPDERD
ncbi:MAG: hypothetical protein R2720_04500 [Candidatus Nanopelagicales bacterium]